MKVGTRTAAAGISSMKCISARMRARLTGFSGVKLASGATSSRYSVMTVEIDDDRAVVVERGHDAVGIELEIIGLELVAGEQIELHLVERQLLGVEHETHPLAAGRLRRVVELESHGGYSRSLSFNQMYVARRNTGSKFMAILLVIVRPDRLSGHVRSRRFPPLGLDGGVNPPPYAHRAP